jgi:hypothetical protein
MMKYFIILSLLFFNLSSLITQAQDLDSLLNAEINNNNEKLFVEATFKSTRIILGQSIENISKGELNFLISHHFGNLNSGAYNFYGLDYSEIRLGFEYGLTKWLSLGIGRSSYNKIYDGNIKLKILKQSSGNKAMPLSMSFYSSIALNTLHWAYPERENRFDSRLSYAFELLLARKMSSKLSLQIVPSMVHRNLVKTAEDQNDVFSVGFGGRIKLTKRFSINSEYYYVLPGKTADDFHDSFSVGFEIETGGHIFQVFFTNSNGLIESAFIPETAGSWSNGDVKLGFNISRTFSVMKKKSIDIDEGF